MYLADHFSALDQCKRLNHDLAWTNHDITEEMLIGIYDEFKAKYADYVLVYSRFNNHFFISHKDDNGRKLI